MPLDRKFVLRQTAVMLKLGIAPIDIERSLTWLESHLPPGADPATWMPTAADLQDDGLVTEATVADARQAWYANKQVPRRYKRILDARSES
jgi:hypothetical protein